MNEKTTIFTDGFYLNKVSEKAPAFIKTNIAINLDKAVAWLLSEGAKHRDERGNIRLVGKESKAGKLYFEVDTYKKPESDDGSTINADDIPF